MDAQEIRSIVEAALGPDKVDHLVAAGLLAKNPKETETDPSKQGVRITKKGFDAMLTLYGLAWMVGMQPRPDFSGPGMREYANFRGGLLFALEVKPHLEHWWPLYEIQEEEGLS